MVWPVFKNCIFSDYLDFFFFSFLMLYILSISCSFWPAFFLSLFTCSCFSSSSRLSTWPLWPSQFPRSPWPRQCCKHNFHNVICSMDGGEKVWAVKTTSALQWRKHKPTYDRFLGLYKWTVPQLPSFSLKASHFCYLPSSSTLHLLCPSCFSSKCLLPLSLNHFPNVMPLSLCLRVSLPHSLPVNWAEITALLTMHGVPGHIIRTNLIRLPHDSHYHGHNAQIQANPLLHWYVYDT